MRKLLTFLILGLTLISAACGSATPTPIPGQTPLPLLPTSTFASFPTHTGQAPVTRTAAPAPSPTLPPTATSSPTATLKTPTPAPPAITFSGDQQHAFPVAGDLSLMTWTHYHWDGSHAVDIEAARHLSSDSDEFQAFIRLPVVAVVSGTVTLADNHYGGLALLLHGDDGYAYYYGHLSEQWVQDGQAVGVGDRLGRIGNTGYNTQYIEPHLHFSIATYTADDWRWEPDVNAAEQFLTWFDLPWQELNIPAYTIDHAAGWPLFVPAEVTRDFSEPLAQNPDQGSIDIMPLTANPDLVPVYATLGGEVNVNRATVMGLRAQITNRPARTTVVFSFLSQTTVADGDVVQRGDLVGFIDPAVGLNYMLFVQDVPTDPVPTLGDPPWATGQ